AARLRGDLPLRGDPRRGAGLRVGEGRPGVVQTNRGTPPVTPEQIQARLKAKFGETVGELVVTADPAKPANPHYEKWFTIDRKVWREAAEFLKTDRELLLDGL